MTRHAAVLLLAAAAAWAGDEEDRTAAYAIREFNTQLTVRDGGAIGSVKNQLIPVMKSLSPRVAKSIRFQLDRGYSKKYGKDEAFLEGISEILAAGGREGIATLWRRYKAEGKRDGVRLGIARALSACGDDDALETLLKMTYDKVPDVAAQAVRGCGAYASVLEKRRKNAVKELVGYYVKVTNLAAGKQPDSKERAMLDALRPAMNEALGSLSRGEKLDSAEAWEAWLRENITQPWPD